MTERRRKLAPSIAFAACSLSSLLATPACADGEYRLGHGYDVGAFNFAGYTNLTATYPHKGRKALTLEELSLFATGHISRYLNPFVEVELTELVFTDSGRDRDGADETEVVLERYYNDSYLTDSLTLRLGKMLAPVGEWNVNHAAPLVLTTTVPAVAHKNFAAFIRGVSLLYSDPEGRAPDVQVYWQPDRGASEQSRGVVFERHKMTEGIHVAFPIELLDKVGFSFQKTEDSKDVDQLLFGIDYRYTPGKIGFQGEVTYSRLSDGSVPRVRDEEAGGYWAVTYALDPKWTAYSWYEAFLQRSKTSAAQDALFGVAYRPLDAMVVKVEYLQNFGGPSVNPTGLFASWSVLF